MAFISSYLHSKDRPDPTQHQTTINNTRSLAKTAITVNSVHMKANNLPCARNIPFIQSFIEVAAQLQPPTFVRILTPAHLLTTPPPSTETP